MSKAMDPSRFILICLAGWINREQQSAIEYLREEIRVLKEHVGPKRLRFTDEQRRRLAARAKKVKFGRLKEIANLATPQTLLDWVKRSEVDAGTRPSTTTAEAQHIKDLERENKELRRANDILRTASAFFAQAELDRKLKS